VLVEKDVVTLGITDFAQSELGEVVFVDLPDVGATFGQGDEIGTIESVKAVAEVYTPIGGEITAVNEALEDAPEKVNDDPHGEGWLVRLRCENVEAIADLMDGAAYREFVENG
jgi:glycine cleavage system H protein